MRISDWSSDVCSSDLLRTSFAKRTKEDGHRLIGITSATPAAGKSFLSMNLDSSLARVVDEPVFLVDHDIWRSSLADDIGLVPERGKIGRACGRERVCQAMQVSRGARQLKKNN